MRKTLVPGARQTVLKMIVSKNQDGLDPKEVPEGGHSPLGPPAPYIDADDERHRFVRQNREATGQST